AGSNITGLTICTTNDMPIIEPASFKALAFFPFQINPHYINIKAEGHNGETRDERLQEYLLVNNQATIIGLPEGTALQLEGKTLTLAGDVPAVIFKNKTGKTGSEKTAIEARADLSYLLK
ncbi:MAG TPA: Type 1 glutamine amidotransferase-like domain-containing protein, partial [Segetibacter sp.]